jgi:high-affinity iron transporter
MLIGVALACIASVLTWFVIRQTLLSFTHYNKQVDALVSLIVVATLMLTTNWFFHKTYWKNWVARFHKHKQRFMKGGTFQFLGLALLGFASIYREGFEIALFLQPYALETNQYIVLQGSIWGFLGIAVVGFISMYIHVRLPYKKVLIVSGFFVGVVLVMLVGDMIHTMQGIGWLPSTPIEGIKTPIWLIIWLDIYPTWQGVLAQISVATFVVGSYYLAEYLQRHKRLQQVHGRNI